MTTALKCSGVMRYARGERSCAQSRFHEEAAIAIEHTSIRARSGLIIALAASVENMRPTSSCIFQEPEGEPSRYLDRLPCWRVCLAPYRIGHKGVALQRLLNRKDQVGRQPALGHVARGAGRECRGNKVPVFMDG